VLYGDIGMCYVCHGVYTYHTMALYYVAIPTVYDVHSTPQHTLCTYYTVAIADLYCTVLYCTVLYYVHVLCIRTTTHHYCVLHTHHCVRAIQCHHYHHCV
jgi:hypothetical protein